MSDDEAAEEPEPDDSDDALGDDEELPEGDLTPPRLIFPSGLSGGFDVFRQNWSSYFGDRQMLFSRQLTEGVAPYFQQAFAPWREHLAEIFASTGWQQAMREITAPLRRYYPSNWTEVSVSEHNDALRIARNEGIPLVWVPGAQLVRELLDAPNEAARRDLLEKNAPDIVDDCAAVVDGEFPEELAPYVKRLRQVIAAHRDGHEEAAQALSAVVVTDFLEWIFDHKRLGKVESSPLRMKGSMGELLLRNLKIIFLIEAAVPASQGGTDWLPDEELPERFMRNTTLHRVAERAYSVANAMTALMLATGLLAEAAQMFEDGRTEVNVGKRRRRPLSR